MKDESAGSRARARDSAAMRSRGPNNTQQLAQPLVSSCGTATLLIVCSRCSRLHFILVIPPILDRLPPVIAPTFSRSSPKWGAPLHSRNRNPDSAAAPTNPIIPMELVFSAGLAATRHSSCLLLHASRYYSENLSSSSRSKSSAPSSFARLFPLVFT